MYPKLESCNTNNSNEETLPEIENNSCKKEEFEEGSSNP